MKHQFIRCLTLAVATCVAPGLLAETVSLSSLDLGQMTSGWSVPKAGHEIAGGPLSIHGEKFTDGVGTHATSKMRVKLNGNAKRFTAEVGVDDSAGTEGSVEFVVS
ncbi:MAG TPA: NPCBM/NEW2 domain-containing protein, partial [Candidatus Binatia bacterium]|nr:NPCBM/NEW2 domain-containing protein [Candidatus Binatia bacterium]